MTPLLTTQLYRTTPAQRDAAREHVDALTRWLLGNGNGPGLDVTVAALVALRTTLEVYDGLLDVSDAPPTLEGVKVAPAFLAAAVPLTTEDVVEHTAPMVEGSTLEAVDDAFWLALAGLELRAAAEVCAQVIGGHIDDHVVDLLGG